MTVSKLHQLRSLRKLTQTLSDLEHHLPAINDVIDDGANSELQAVAAIVTRLAALNACYTKAMSGVVVTQEAEPEHKSVADVLNDLADTLEGATPEAAKQWADPHITTATHRVIKGAVGLLWVTHGAKSRELGAIVKNCYSPAGWDRKHEADLRVIELARGW